MGVVFPAVNPWHWLPVLHYQPQGHVRRELPPFSRAPTRFVHMAKEATRAWGEAPPQGRSSQEFQLFCNCGFLLTASRRVSSGRLPRIDLSDYRIAQFALRICSVPGIMNDIPALLPVSNSRYEPGARSSVCERNVVICNALPSGPPLSLAP